MGSTTKDGLILGGISTFVFLLGNIGFRLSGSQSMMLMTGYIASVDYAALGPKHADAPNLRGGIYDSYSYQPWVKKDPQVTLRQSTALSALLMIYTFPFHTALDKESGYDAVWTADASLLGLTQTLLFKRGSITKTLTKASNTEGVVSVDWTWSSDDGKYSADAGYASDTEVLRQLQ